MNWDWIASPLVDIGSDLVLDDLVLPECPGNAAVHKKSPARGGAAWPLGEKLGKALER